MGETGRMAGRTDAMAKPPASIARRRKRRWVIICAACLLGITLALVWHELVAMRYNHDGSNALRWVSSFLVGGVWGALVARIGRARDGRATIPDMGVPHRRPFRTRHRRRR